MEKGKVFILCAIITATACFVTGMTVYFYQTSQEKGNEFRVGGDVGGNYQSVAKYMEIGDLEKIIGDYYYEEVPEDELVTGAKKGMVESLGDPYSTYYTEEEYANYVAGSEGTYVGVGISAAPLSRDLGYLKVVAAQGGGPAQAAGISEGDVIVAVDGNDLKNMDFEGAYNLIYGPAGSDVTLTVQSQGTQHDVGLVRQEVQTPYVNASTLDETVGYISISEFKGDCVAEFEKALTSLTEEDQVKGIVIDLRNNMGGSVKSAADMLDMIMPEGVVFYSVDKNGDKSEYAAKAEYNDIPIAVIVNGGTASASELFAGAVQDGARGKVIGELTYGKGVEQAVTPMPYSSGAVKLTTATYFTPKGNPVNGVGITPDEAVAMPESTVGLTAATDPQLQAAKTAVMNAIGA